MRPSRQRDIRRLTDEQRRSLLAEIRNARVKGCDEVRIRFVGERAVKVIAMREFSADTIRPDNR